jgi:hypothetical protein
MNQDSHATCSIMGSNLAHSVDVVDFFPTSLERLVQTLSGVPAYYLLDPPFKINQADIRVRYHMSYDVPLEYPLHPTHDIIGIHQSVTTLPTFARVFAHYFMIGVHRDVYVRRGNLIVMYGDQWELVECIFGIQTVTLRYVPFIRRPQIGIEIDVDKEPFVGRGDILGSYCLLTERV